ncbi:hypothetical protein [Streptomyces sp. NPDC058084]|uniref:hypothetical protein n=1 Tax=Streptomyces sp. NPDC058084 TaxID=3346333 RepID=UPI0036EC8E8F
MSVTFTAGLRPPAGFAVGCGCPEATLRALRFGDYRDAQDAAARANAAPGTRGPLPGCAMPAVCPEYPLHAEEVDPDGIVPYVNVSSVNAVGILEALGLAPASEAAGYEALEPDLPAQVPADAVVIPIASADAYGQLPTADFHARVVTALGLAPEDPGVPAYRLGRTLVGGRAAGYLQQRLRDLHELSAWCATRGRDVAWH